MYITVLKSKLHRVKVTSTNIDYDGSCGIDKDWMDALDIKEYEQMSSATGNYSNEEIELQLRQTLLYSLLSYLHEEKRVHRLYNDNNDIDLDIKNKINSITTSEMNHIQTKLMQLLSLIDNDKDDLNVLMQ